MKGMVLGAFSLHVDVEGCDAGLGEHIVPVLVIPVSESSVEKRRKRTCRCSNFRLHLSGEATCYRQHQRAGLLKIPCLRGVKNFWSARVVEFEC